MLWSEACTMDERLRSMAAWLVNRTHVPHNMPHKIKAGVVTMILGLRCRQPSWGLRKSSCSSAGP
jgi:hypothetical protein